MSDYKNPKWQKARLKILERDGWACQNCLASDEDAVCLHVHHMYYIKGVCLWDYPTYALVTLCEECHNIEHEGDSFYRGKNLLSSALNSFGFLGHDFEFLGADILRLIEEGKVGTIRNEYAISMLCWCIQDILQNDDFYIERYKNHLAEKRKASKVVNG